jgi:multiple sugar transport system substrate-binding protein
MTKSSVTTKRTARIKLSAVALSALAFAGTHGVSANAATIKVAYSRDYFMSSPELAQKWFASVKSQFEAAHPGDTLQLIPIPGSFDDFNTKISLMFNSPSTAPDVVQIALQSAGDWSGSGLLAPLNDYVDKTSWWKQFPEPVKQEAEIDGKIYGVSEGDNTFGLLYDRSLFAKAGLPSDWHPANWAAILEAARAVKKAEPNVWPIWLMTGTAQGSEGVLMGAGLLMAGSSVPTIYDTKTGKWVVDSKGIREVLSFYRDASAEGLLAPSSQILDANAPNNGAQHLPAHQIAISFAGNYWPTMWNSVICTPCWKDPDNTIAAVSVPTSEGQKQASNSSFGGWGASMYSKTANPDLAWSLIDIMQRKQNMVAVDNYGGLVPSVPAYNDATDYVDFAKKPFQQVYATFLPTAMSMPASQEYGVWSYAIAQATETLVLKPTTPIDTVVATMKAYVARQLGDDRVETLN